MPFAQSATEVQMEGAQRLLRQLIARNGGPAGAIGRRQRAVGDLRIRARRRRGIVDDPAIERAEQRAHGGRVVERIEHRATDHAAADVRRRRKRTRTVRRRRDHVDARVRRQLGVLRARRIGVHQRAGAVEVLGVGQQVEDLRRGAGPFRARQQAVGRAGFRIGRRTVGERKQVDRKQDVEELQRVARRLAEAVIERAAARAADLIEHAVEHLASLLVLVEPLVEEMPEEPSALRHAPADRVAKARRRIVRRRVVLQEADQIARAGQAAAEHARVGGAIDDVVDAAGLEAAVERHGPAVDEAPARRAG